MTTVEQFGNTLAYKNEWLNSLKFINKIAFGGIGQIYKHFIIVIHSRIKIGKEAYYARSFW